MEIEQRVELRTVAMQLRDLAENDVVIAAFVDRGLAADHPSERMF